MLEIPEAPRSLLGGTLLLAGDGALGRGRLLVAVVADAPAAAAGALLAAHAVAHDLDAAVLLGRGRGVLLLRRRGGVEVGPVGLLHLDHLHAVLAGGRLGLHLAVGRVVGHAEVGVEDLGAVLDVGDVAEGARRLLAVGGRGAAAALGRRLGRAQPVLVQAQARVVGGAAGAHGTARRAAGQAGVAELEVGLGVAARLVLHRLLGRRVLL